MYAWRSIYWSEQTSMRTRAMLMMDWVKVGPLFAAPCAWDGELTQNSFPHLPSSVVSSVETSLECVPLSKLSPFVLRH